MIILKRGIIVLALLMLLTGCSNNIKEENNNTVENNVEESQGVNEDEQEKVYSEFEGLGKLYTVNKNIVELEDGTQIYDNWGETPYIYGEYLEVDFAVDLITEYLLGNDGIYANVIESFDGESEDVALISEGEKERLVESTDFLREQMGIEAGGPIYFNLNKVIYNGKVGEDSLGVSIEIRGHISAYQGYYASISTFTVEVYKKNGKLYGIIS